MVKTDTLYDPFSFPFLFHGILGVLIMHKICFVSHLIQMVYLRFHLLYMCLTCTWAQILDFFWGVGGFTWHSLCSLSYIAHSFILPVTAHSFPFNGLLIFFFSWADGILYRT